MKKLFLQKKHELFESPKLANIMPTMVYMFIVMFGCVRVLRYFQMILKRPLLCCEYTTQAIG